MAAPWRRFFHAARWNGYAAHSTTGEARRQHEPLPVLELERVDHRDHQNRDPERGGDDEPVAEREQLRVGCVGVLAGGVVSGGLRLGRNLGGVADRLDLGDDVVDGDRVGQRDGGLLGGVVHGGVDAVELVEALGDARRARGARHAADVERDSRRGRGGAGVGGGGVGHRSHISMSGVPVTGPWSKVNEAVWTVPLCLKSKNRP